jgi:hypothetical protein
MRVWRDTMSNQQLFLYGVNISLGWRIVRTIHRLEGERGVSSGKFREVHEEVTGKLLGYQIIGTVEQRGDQDIPSLASSAAISPREMDANAGLLGRSKTEGRSEDARIRRDPHTSHLLPMEDFIERAAAKVRVFPRVGAARGDILLAWPK